MSDSQTAEATIPRMGMGTDTPLAVVAAADRADQMIRELAARAAAPATPPAEVPQGEAPASTEVANAAPAKAGGEGMQPAPEPMALASPPAEASSDAMTLLRAEVDRLTQELRTWRGRYEAELPRERELRVAMERQLAEASERLKALDTVATPAVPAYTPLTDSEIEQYGEDMFAMVERFLMPKVEARLNALLTATEARFARVEGNLGTTNAKVQKTEQDMFYDRLTERMPAWRDVDADPAFTAWLEEQDELFGEPRKNALYKRATNRDDAGVVKVFEAFLNQRGASGSRNTAAAPSTPAPGTGAQPTAPAVQAAPAPSLADFAAPGRPSTAPNPASGGAPGGKRNWSLAEIRQFYVDLRKGVYAGRDGESSQIERDIAAAQREGRVTS